MINKEELKKFMEQKRPEGKRSDWDRKFYPSAADRWINCPASVNLTRGIPFETSKYAEEGQLAHSVCEAKWGLSTESYPLSIRVESKTHGIKG